MSRQQKTRDAYIESWEALVEGTIASTRGLVSNLTVSPLDAPSTRIPLNWFVKDLLHDSSSRELQVRDNLETVKGLAINLLLRVVINHLDACSHLLRRGLRQEAGVLLRSLLEAVDLMEFFRSKRCSPKDLVAWWSGEIILHGKARKGTKTFHFRGALHEQVVEAVVSMGGIKSPLAEAFRRVQHRRWSRYVHHSARTIAAVTVPECAGDAESWAELLAEFNSYLVWGVRAVPFYLAPALSESDRQSLNGLGNQLAREIFNDEFEEFCQRLGAHYASRAAAL